MKFALAALLVLLVAIAFAQQSQPAATADPAPVPTASNLTTETSDSVADHLKMLEDSWMKSAMDKNSEEMMKIEAADYQFTMPDGKVRSRDEDIAAMNNSSYSEASVSDMSVRVFGDTGIVTGIAHLKGTENGKDISGDYRFTDVFVRRDGTWQAVNTDATKINP
jgi:ketosteroid isomerase-like protein